MPTLTIRPRALPGRIKFIAGLFVSFLLLACVEAVLRLAGYVEIPQPPILASESIPAEEIENGRWVYRFHPYWFWEPRPGSLVHSYPSERINSAGYRGPLKTEEPRAGKTRIVALGDSSTFGYKVAYSTTFTAIVEKELANVEVLNFGIPGYTAFQGEQLLRHKVLKQKPHIVLLSFGAINEYWPAYSADVDEKFLTTSRSSPKIWAFFDALSQFRLFQLMNSSMTTNTFVQKKEVEVYRRKTEKEKGVFRRNQSRESYIRSMVSMVLETRRHGAQAVILLPPRRSGVEQRWEWSDDYIDASERIAERYSLPCIDVNAYFHSIPNSDATLFIDDFHPNSKGHNLYGKFLAARLRRVAGNAKTGD